MIVLTGVTFLSKMLTQDHLTQMCARKLTYFVNVHNLIDYVNEQTWQDFIFLLELYRRIVLMVYYNVADWSCI